MAKLKQYKYIISVTMIKDEIEFTSRFIIRAVPIDEESAFKIAQIIYKDATVIGVKVEPE